MGPKIQNLAVQIVRFVDDHQPGWVEFEFVDAEGRQHKFIDKIVIFTADLLNSGSAYPQSGGVRSEVLAEWRDARGRQLVRVSTARPEGIDSTDGVSEFVVPTTQLS